MKHECWDFRFAWREHQRALGDNYKNQKKMQVNSHKGASNNLAVKEEDTKPPSLISHYQWIPPHDHPQVENIQESEKIRAQDSKERKEKAKRIFH